jgi:pyridinium-3,5-bisthiocarboxylic acid mononucleotide nickel chelatase
MTVALLDPFSGISGDMMLGALVGVGLEAEWLAALPSRLGLDGVSVEIREVQRGGIACCKVEFEIPPQPHGRHLREIRALVAAAGVPESVRERADRAFTLIAEQEGAIHGVPAEKVHLHEVGAIDAILDVVGTIWGLEQLGVREVFCGAIQLGDGFVRAAHGVLPVPAPATMRLLEGLPVRPGPEGAGELVTPTGAALVRVLSSGMPPREYIPRRSGFGAGTKDFRDRANALRIVLADVVSSAEGRESLVQLSADVDDMTPEYLAAAADALRIQGALDVVMLPLHMKKGRAGTRVEVLAEQSAASHLEEQLLRETSTIGVRRWTVERRALIREIREVSVLGHRLRVKVVTLPDGRHRAKPEFEDVERIALATDTPALDIFRIAASAAEREP